MLQIHGPSGCLTAEKVHAYMNDTFAVLEFGPVRFYIDDPEQCDWLIKATVEAKRLLEPPVIDSERTCQQANPDSGAWCHRGGDHGVHEDADGETWRTDGGEDRCECSHQKPEHGHYAIGTAPAAAHECRHPGCGCTAFRPAAPRPHAEPPAVVNGDVVLEVRALLS